MPRCNLAGIRRPHTALLLTLPLLLAPAAGGGNQDFVLEGVHGLPSLAALAWSRDGQRVYAGGTDDIVRVFDAEDLSLQQTWGHRGARIDHIAVAPDGSSLAAGDRDGVVTFYATRDGSELSRFGGNGRPVAGLAWEGDRIGVAALHGPIRVLESSGRPLTTIEGPGERFLRVQFALRCERVAAAGRGGDVRVWDTRTGRLLQHLRVGDVETTQLAFDEDCGRIAGQDWDGHVRIWSIEEGELLATLPGSGRTGGLAFLGDEVLGRGPQDLPLRWSLDGTRHGDWTAPPRWTGLPPEEDLSASPTVNTRHDLALYDGRFVEAYGDTLRLWTKTGQLLASQETGLSAITDVAATTELVVAATRDGRVLVRHATEGDLVGVMTLPGAPVRDIALDRRGRRLAVAGPDNLVRVWEPLAGGQPVTLFGHKEAVGSVAWSPSGQLASASPKEPEVLIWNLDSRQVGRRLMGFEGGISGLAWASSQLAVWASEEAGLKVLDLSGVQQSRSRVPHQGGQGSFNGTTVASVAGGDVALVDAYTGLQLAFSHTAVFWPSVAFSPDGTLLAGGTSGGSVQVLDRKTGALVVSLRGHAGAVNAVAFSADGALLVSGSEDGTVRVWSR